jgi:ABC-2 type transport system ATP-binding protein
MVITGLDSTVIAATAAANAIDLIELAPQTASLEQAFLELTAGDTEYAAPRLTGIPQR